MPSKTSKQARTMRAVSNNKELASKLNIKQGVAREFVKADKRKAQRRKLR